MMIVNSEYSRPMVRLPYSIADCRARAVTIPGRAMGSTSAKEMASRPKNRNRCTANAANDPSTSAIAVAHAPAIRELASAERRVGSFHAMGNHFVVHRSGGQDASTLRLNAYTTTISNGR